MPGASKGRPKGDRSAKPDRAATAKKPGKAAPSRTRSVSAAASAKKVEHAAEKPNSLTAKAYGEILKRIVRLELQPGRAFTEGELAGELELSKTPVREALLVLGSHGFVFPRPRSGYRVAPVTVKDARDMFAMWKTIGAECAAVTAKRGVEPALVLHLEDLATHDIDTADPDSIDSFVNEEIDFHTHLAIESGNGRLQRATHVLLQDFQRLLRLTIQLDPAFTFDGHDHDKLVAAIANREVDAARDLARTAVERWESVIVEALLSSDAVQAVNLGAPLTGRDE